MPRIQSNELKDRVCQYPLSKNELVDYLVRLQGSKEILGRDIYRKLMAQPKFKEILDEVQLQRIKQKECKKIMNLCQSTSEDTHVTLNKVSYEILDEKLRGKEFETMVGII